MDKNERRKQAAMPNRGFGRRIGSYKLFMIRYLWDLGGRDWDGEAQAPAQASPSRKRRKKTLQ
jgi:hypothetical protein